MREVWEGEMHCFSSTKKASKKKPREEGRTERFKRFNFFTA